MHRAASPMSTSIEDTIDRVEQLYATITGRTPNHENDVGPRIPPEIDPVRHLEDQVGKLVAELEHGFAPDSAGSPQWQPRAFAWRDDAAFELAIDLPGVPREQIELRVEERVLIVRGQRPAPWGDRETPPVACEAPFGNFARAFVLPERVEPGQITARLDAGMLRVRVTRSAPSEPSPIPITCS